MTASWNWSPMNVETLPKLSVPLSTAEQWPHCFGPEWAGRLAPDGWSLWKDARGKVMALNMAAHGFIVRYYRLCVRVPAHSAV